MTHLSKIHILKPVAECVAMLDGTPYSISQRIADLRAKAHSGGLPVRRSDAKLYDLLGQCLTLFRVLWLEAAE